METIEEGKQYLKDNWQKGTSCPCCGQFVKLWPHQINSAITRTLIAVYNHQDEWVNIFRDLKPPTTMYSIAAFWGLIEQKGDEPENGSKTSGYWRLTEKGRNFVERKATIPKRAYVYNNAVRAFSNDQVDIIHTLGKKFDYEELIGMK